MVLISISVASSMSALNAMPAVICAVFVAKPQVLLTLLMWQK
jgi:hypothetical protein